MKLHVGTSGYSYKEWKGNFYPEDLPAKEMLAYYSTRLPAVEINNTFYRLPEAPTFEAWGRRAPPRFLYALKASRFLTHMKKLKDPEEPIERFFSRARELGASFGPVLYQLPPRWPVNVERLAAFLRQLPRRRQHAFEFREPSWYSDEVFALLLKHRAALCLHDMTGSASPRIAVGPFVYVRYHGTTKYAGRYDDAALGRWADWLAATVRRGTPFYAYFNNDVGGHAPRDASRLRAMVFERLASE
jgi:uncharacterized protein YecE (DUF72 family)